MNTIKNEGHAAGAQFVRFCHTQRFILLFLSIFLYSSHLFSQNELSSDGSPEIDFTFLTVDAEIPSGGSIFNVLRVKNNRTSSFSGRISVSVPEDWNIIGLNSANLELAPSEEYLFPVRISVPPSVLGGISYMLNAEIKGGEYYDYTSAYISITPVSKWEMRVNTKKIFVSEYRPQAEFSVELINKGNFNEMIKLSFDTGGLLEYVTPIEGDSILFVELPAYRDTILSFKVRQKAELSYAEERSMINNWRSSSIFMKASTSESSSSAGLRVFSLESQSFNDIKYRNSPLNIDLSMNNLLSYQKPKVDAKISGKLLFPDSQQLQYMVGVNNIYFDRERNQQTDFFSQVRFKLHYNDRNTSVEMGDRIGMGELHTLSGQGIRAQHTVNDKHTIYLNAANNPFNNNIGVFTGYSTSIKSIGINTGLTFESNTKTSDGHYSYQLGGTFNILRKHRFRINTVTSLDHFSSGTYLPNDTTKVGFAYRLSYSYTGKKFKIRIDNTNTKLSYLRTSGINRVNLRSVYKISDFSRIEGIYSRNNYDATRYPYNFVYPSNKNITDNANLLYSITKGSTVYYIGPQLTNNIRSYYNPSNGLSTIYSNIQPGILGSVTFRLGTIRSITPYMRVNSMFVNYESEDVDFTPYEINGLMQYSLGLSYYDKAFKFNAYFSSGDASDIYRSVVVEEDPQVNQSFHLRPYYERYFNNESIRLSGYLNYSYYLPSTRENMIFNLTSDFIMNKGWRLFLSFNLYRIVRSDEVSGRVASRDVNILTGVRKSFDIQQPRIKYYDVVIVGFNDENGNGVKDNNEKPISNVMVEISRDANKNVVQRTGFAEIALISDPNGEIYYEGMPEGVYDLNITSLSNLESLFFLNGEDQEMEIHSDLTHYLPLVETYKVKGRIIIDRDPNSNEGNISLEGVRVTAVSENGETFSALTDSYGGYILSLPKAATYEVALYNVYGEQFVLEQGRYKIQFSSNKTVNLDFKFTEKRRQLQFQEGEQYFDFNLNRQN